MGLQKTQPNTRTLQIQPPPALCKKPEARGHTDSFSNPHRTMVEYSEGLKKEKNHISCKKPNWQKLKKVQESCIDNASQHKQRSVFAPNVMSFLLFVPEGI